MENTTLVGVAWLMKAKELYNLQQQRRFLEKREKELSLELQALSNNEEKSYGGIRYYYEIRTGYINYHEIPELKNVNLDLYRKPSMKAWKLVVENL